MNIPDNIDRVDGEWILRYSDALPDSPFLINLGIGEPDFDTPQPVKDVACRFIGEGKTKYTPTAGIPELREKIAGMYNRRWGAGLSGEDVMITPGGGNALFLSLSSILREGDEVLVPSPAYPSFAAIPRIIGATPIEVPTTLEAGFKPAPDQLREHSSGRTRAIVVNSPSNPTGAVYDERLMRGIVDLAAELGAYIVSDEVYDAFVYSGSFTSAAKFRERYEKIVIVNSFSKTFAMTGWRLGYVISGPPLMERLLKLQVYMNACAPSFAQYAVSSVLDSPDLAEAVRIFRDVYRERRDLIVSLLTEAGFPVFKPEGAFFAFPRIPIPMRDEEFCNRLISEEGVALMPGRYFGSSGRGHFRLTYSAGKEDLEEAGRRLARFAASLLRNK